jgi:hypothetical protein
MEDFIFVIIVSCAVFGATGYWVAGVKRRSTDEGMWLGVLLGPLGVIIETLLPTQTLRPCGRRRRNYQN